MLAEPASGQLHFIPTQGDTEKDRSKGKSSSGHSFKQYIWLFTIWSVRWPEVQIQTNSGAVANDLTGWLGTQKEQDCNIGEKEVWGRGMWVDNLNKTIL